MSGGGVGGAEAGLSGDRTTHLTLVPRVVFGGATCGWDGGGPSWLELGAAIVAGTEMGHRGWD